MGDATESMIKSEDLTKPEESEDLNKPEDLSNTKNTERFKQMNNTDFFKQIAIEIIQALSETNNGLVCKQLNYCLKRVKSIRTQDNYIDKRIKFTLSEIIANAINCNKHFKPIKKIASKEMNNSQLLRNALNIKDTKKTTYNSMKAKAISDKVTTDKSTTDKSTIDKSTTDKSTNWADDASSDDDAEDSVDA